MKHFTLIFSFTLLFFFNAFAQTRTLTGRILDPATKEALIGASVVVKGSTSGVTTDLNGNFSLQVPNDAKALTISYVGYTAKDVPIGASNVININLESSTVVTSDVTVTSSRTTETIKQSAVQIEKMGTREIKNAASGDFYQNISNFKGVDLVTTSFGFKVLNLRGFSGTNSGRSLQLIDGIDNQAPGLNFPLGNLVGINDLDLQSVEVISGPASALYGANAMQGVINMTSKSAFDVQGLALQIKGGGTTVPAGYVEAQFRYAQAFGKKKNWAFKVTGSYMQTKDWAAEDDSFNRYGNIRTTQDVTFILRKKALQDVGPNFTQDSKDKLIRLTNWLDFNPIANPKNLDIQAPGYMESEMTNYKTYSLKLAAELHYKITKDIDLSYTGKFGMGNAVYQSVSRYQLKDIIFHQHKLELKGKNFVVRGYVSADDAGNSYDIRRTAQYISRASVTDYITNFNTSYFDSLRVYTDGFNADNEARNWMADSAKRVAIKYADATGWQAGGSPKFDSLYKVITADPRGKLGTKFIDHSALYHLEAQWNFLNTKHIDMIGGGSYRAYIPASQGTIFADSLIDKGDTLSNGFPNPKGRYAKIVVQEYGAYAQATVKLWKDHIRLLGTVRVDKNTNYPVRVSPRGAVVAKFGDHTIRVGVSTAFKSPTLQEQYLNLDLGVIQLIGNKDGQKNLYTYNSVLDAKEYYENNTTDPYNKEVAAKMLVKTELAPLKPEQVTSIDFGYRGDFLQKKLSIDIAGYYSWYKNFIGFTRVVRPMGGVAGEASGETDVIASIVQPTTKYYTLYQIYVNSNNIVPAWGASISASYYVGKGIAPYINYTYADLKESNLSGTGATVLSGFNAPRHKFNIGVIGTKVYKGLGFSANFKYVNNYFWQSSFADAEVPSFHTLDLQVSYELEKYYSTIRIGGSNIYNNKHIEAAGSPKIGALYYISWTFDFNKFKFLQK